MKKSVCETIISRLKQNKSEFRIVLGYNNDYITGKPAKSKWEITSPVVRSLSFKFETDYVEITQKSYVNGGAEGSKLKESLVYYIDYDNIISIVKVEKV